MKCNLSDGRGEKIYIDGLYVALAGIPGTLLGIVTVNIVGARAMLSECYQQLLTVRSSTFPHPLPLQLSLW